MQRTPLQSVLILKETALRHGKVKRKVFRGMLLLVVESLPLSVQVASLRSAKRENGSKHRDFQFTFYFPV